MSNYTVEGRVLAGIDTGGTFTDFVVLDETGIRTHKVLSTPKAPEQAIVAGLNDLGCADLAMSIVHGSTIATNAILEGKGARTALITNRGFSDLLTIGRQARQELYNLQPFVPAVPVVPELCFEVDARLAADGTVLSEIGEGEIGRVRAAVAASQPAAVAIVLLFSFLDDSSEQRIAEALGSDFFVSCSADVLAERGEYERGITTWLNAYVGPLVQGYLRRLAKLQKNARLSIMQSAGTTCDGAHAARYPVNLMLSGPAGGLRGAHYLGRQAGFERLISFDMGGTSTDVALLDGTIGLSSEGHIGRYPVAVPMVDMHTIGAGGGSLARVDAGGLLTVGPDSAGAVPGPACYGQGGAQATVTDANVVLGRLPSTTRLGGSLGLQVEPARRVLDTLARSSGLPSAEHAAAGVVRVANEHMARAVRVISVERGHDPRDYTLLAFGGAGGLHVCELADLLGMCRALVPANAGVLSALGMLVAPRGRQLSRTLGGLLGDYTVAEIEHALGQLRERCRVWLAAEGLVAREMADAASLDLCYDGQSFTLNVPWTGRSDAAEAAFHLAHARRYGHRMEVPLRLINIRLAISQRDIAPLDLRLKDDDASGEPLSETALFGVGAPAPMWHAHDLRPGQNLAGPCIVLESAATCYVAPGWSAQRDRYGNLILRR